MLLQAYVELKLYEQNVKLVMVGVKDLANKDFNDYYEALPPRIKSSILIIHVSYSDW